MDSFPLMMNTRGSISDETVKLLDKNFDKIADKIGALNHLDYRNEYDHYQKPSKILLYCRAGRGVKSLNDSNDQDLGDDSKTT